MPFESALAVLQVIAAILNFICLIIGLKIALAISELRTEFLKLLADHVRDYHNHTDVPRTTR